MTTLGPQLLVVGEQVRLQPQTLSVYWQTQTLTQTEPCAATRSPQGDLEGGGEEAGGERARTLEPLAAGHGQVAARLVELVGHADLRRDLSARGPRQAARFTWAKAAEQTRAVYEAFR